MHLFEAKFPRLHSWLTLEHQRLALSWYAKRHKRGRPVTLHRDDDLIRVHDGVREFWIPHLCRATDFRDGVNHRLSVVAEKYFGATGFMPRQGDAVVDVGAGIGEFAVWCADAGARVVAFEPDPLALRCLERNIAAFAGVDIHPYALWKERSTLRLQASLDSSESSLIEDGTGSLRTADVEAWPLDRLQFMARLPVIDLMKVDGEGVEPEIIAGAARALRRTRVVAVDVSATSRRQNLRARVEMVLDSLSFRTLPHDRTDTILALNTAMVGPFSSRVPGRLGF